MNAIEIREVDADHPHVIALLGLYFAELRARLGNYEPPSRDGLRADAARGALLVGYESGVAVGTGALRMLGSKTAEVKRMFIAPKARGRGHARRILRALEDKALALGCTGIVLDSAPSRSGELVPTRGLQQHRAVQQQEQPGGGAPVRKEARRRRKRRPRRRQRRTRW